MDIKTLNTTSAPRPHWLAAVANDEKTVHDTAGEASGRDSGHKAGIPLYPSPIYRYDNAAEIAVLTFRDGMTGQTTHTLPPERIVAEYRRAGGKPDPLDTILNSAPSAKESTVPVLRSGDTDPGAAKEIPGESGNTGFGTTDDTTALSSRMPPVNQNQAIPSVSALPDGPAPTSPPHFVSIDV